MLAVIYCLNDDTEKAEALAAEIRKSPGRVVIRNGHTFVPAHAISCTRVLVLPGCDPRIAEHYGDITEMPGVPPVVKQPEPAAPSPKPVRSRHKGALSNA